MSLFFRYCKDMPALPPLSHTYDLIARNATTDAVVPALAAAVQVIATPTKVVCSWPVSGQYGPGSRVLYYVLVAACVLARKTEWLRNACLAAALIFPAVAAVHGVALAALHVPNAIDMDIYGAFQFCSIGILTAPITVRLSTTYFNNPGRNTIFLWAGIILVGLLALTVEFFRSEAVPCVTDESRFVYGESLCGLVCSIEDGPYSPMRQGSADEIYVIPEPFVITFGTATLFCAACCIPAILSMISMWDKILKVNWQERFGETHTDNQPETGTNGATPARMNKVNRAIREFLSVVEVPVFGAAVVAIIVVGELNFWSEPVNWQTEPMANVGQWAPIVASAFAACGSLYMLLAEDMIAAANPTMAHCNCSHHHEELDVQNGLFISQSGPGRTSEEKSSIGPHRPDAGRSKIAKGLSAISRILGTADLKSYDDSEFQDFAASKYPTTPGEEFRHPNLRQLEDRYNLTRPEDEERGRRRSRANSFTGSVTGFARPSPPSSARALSPNPAARQEPNASSLQILPAGSPRPDPNNGPSNRASHDSGPRHNDDPDTTSPSAKPGSSVTIQPSGFNSPSIVVSAENEPVGILPPPPVHIPSS